MVNLLSSPEFWIGAFLLCAFQVAKFSELDGVDEDLKGRCALVPNLRVSDFLGPKQYVGILALFLTVTFIGYLLLCLASPTLISGWVRITSGMIDAQKIDELVKSVPYPLYIAAAFMGLAHQAIPGFSRIANFQRSVFHDWVGVPRIVVATSDDFAIQILAQAQTKNQLVARVKELASSQWRAKIKSYADISFYNNEINRLRLADEDELAEAVKGSQRELKLLIEQLIYVASIATVRRSGGWALSKLADDLGVTAAERSTPPVSGILSGALLSVVALTILWFVIPMVGPLVNRTMVHEFWPEGPGASGAYLLSHVVPVLIAVLVLMMFLWPARKNDGTENDSEADEEDSATVGGLIEKHASLLLAIMLVIIVFDYLQTLSDYGVYNVVTQGKAVAFFLSWLPYHALHSIISVVICLLILMHIARWEHVSERSALIRDWLVLIFVVALVAVFYAEARLFYQFRKPGALDYVALVVFLNVAAATIALLASRSIWRRRLAKSRAIDALRRAKAAAIAAPPST